MTAGPSLRANVLKGLNVARCKTAEARISRLRAFIGNLDWDDVAWLRENSAPEFVDDLHQLRRGIDLLLNATSAGGEA
jgi:hypothetical protein